MENIAYIGLSHQISIKQQMEVTANNIANMSTPGYKSQDMVFLEYVTNPKGGDKVSQVLDYSSFRKTEQGPLSMTNNPLDMALQGDGYFAVESPEGVRYTRAGNFTLNVDNEIVTMDGYPLLGEGNAPIVIPQGDANITVTADGAIVSDSGEQGRIKLVRFENEQELIESGHNLYDAAEQQEEIADNVTVQQGMIEGSNVQSIIEMNNMIEGLRKYQAVQSMLQKDHERQRSAIQKLTRVN